MTMERFDAYLAVIAHTLYVVILALIAFLIISLTKAESKRGAAQTTGAQTDCAAITFALPNLFYGESAHAIPVHSNPLYTQEAVYVPEN